MPAGEEMEVLFWNVIFDELTVEPVGQSGAESAVSLLLKLTVSKFRFELVI